MQPKLQQLDLFGGPAQDIGGVKEKKKAKAKAAAKAAGRPYPNMVDNIRAAMK